MRITYHEGKRAQTLARRELDFADAQQVLANARFTLVDDRRDYGEVRYQTVGYLGSSLVMVVWTPRGEARHVISMRKCNARERERYRERVD